jgi:branched chain amino acid efflux pump
MLSSLNLAAGYAAGLNARHILLGAVLAPWLLQVPTVRRLAALLLLSDANFAQAISARDRGEMDAGILFGAAREPTAIAAS